MSTIRYARVFVAAAVHWHNFAMEYDIPNIIAKMLAGPPKRNQTQVAKLLSTRKLPVLQPYISRWKGGVDPEVQFYTRIIDVAKELGIIQDVRSEDVAAGLEPQPKRVVRVKGYVGAGGEAHYYSVDAIGDLDTIEASDQDTDQTVAVRIIGKSLGDFFDRWYVTYDDVRSPITDDMIGELCVVGLDDDRVLVKKIARNGTPDTYDLLSNSDKEPPIKGVRIEWGAKVAQIRRG